MPIAYRNVRERGLPSHEIVDGVEDENNAQPDEDKEIVGIQPRQNQADNTQ